MTLLTLLVFAGFMAFALCAQADPTDAFRRFSRRLLEAVPIQSSIGFVYSTELLARFHRLGWPMAEVPAQSA